MTLRKEILDYAYIDGDSGLGEACINPVVRAQNLICVSHTAVILWAPRDNGRKNDQRTNAPKFWLNYFLFVAIRSDEQETQRPSREGRKSWSNDERTNHTWN
jgi:hypothetical protein